MSEIHSSHGPEREEEFETSVLPDRRPPAAAPRPLAEYARVTVSSETRDEPAAARELRRWLEEEGFRHPFIVTSRHGRAIWGTIPRPAGIVIPPAGADRHWAHALARTIGESQAGTVVAVGGGRLLDLAKLAAGAADRTLVAVPTQLSHDGICSPVAVVPALSGGVESLPAVSPTAVFFSIPTLAASPERSIIAGVGDLISNPFALRDWEMAAVRGKDHIVEPAWHLSMEAAHLVEPRLEGLRESGVRRPQFLGLLAHSLTNSGFAMRAAGSSRPASGAEHKISHTIDSMYGGRALHGEQVAFACLISAVLQGVDPDPLLDTLRGLGLPHRPEHLGLSHEELVAVVLAARRTKPERFTALENADLGRKEAAALVRDLWGGDTV